MDSDIGAAIESINSCICVLQGNLHQPGTPAIVLKLEASWEKLKPFLSSRTPHKLQNSSIGGGADDDDTVAEVNSAQAPVAAAAAEPCSVGVVAMETLNSENEQEEVSQEEVSESHETQSSGLQFTIV